jgi:hypothetical protein
VNDRRATSMNRMIVTHCAAEPMSCPTTRFMYMLAGVMISPTNTAPIIALSPNPSSQWSGAGMSSRNWRSSSSSRAAAARKLDGLVGVSARGMAREIVRETRGDGKRCRERIGCEPAQEF